MLILTRNIGQKIIVNDRDVEFIILGVTNGQVRIGINAREDINVHREEIFKRMKAENNLSLKKKPCLTYRKSKFPW